jgi:hypothetical protein
VNSGESSWINRSGLVRMRTRSTRESIRRRLG